MSCEDIIRLTLWTAQPKLSVIGILQGQYDVKGGFCETLKISLNLLISLNPPKKWTWIGLNFVFDLSPSNRVITEDPVNKTRPLTCLVLLELAPFHIWKYVPPGSTRNPIHKVWSSHEYIGYTWLRVNLMYSKCWIGTLDWLSCHCGPEKQHIKLATD